MKTRKHSSRNRFMVHGLTAALALYGAWNLSAADRNGQLDRKDTAFIKEATQGGESEIQMGKLAAEKAQNPSVKELGQHLQQDHSKANQELLQIAQKNGVTLPAEPTRKEERLADRLQDKSGADFDKAFADHAIKDHVKDIEKFQKASQNTKDAELKAFIDKTLPVLQQHLQMARTAGAAVGVDASVLASADRILANPAGTYRTLPAQGIGNPAGSESGKGANSISTDRNDSSSAPDRTQPNK